MKIQPSLPQTPAHAIKAAETPPHAKVSPAQEKPDAESTVVFATSVQDIAPLTMENIHKDPPVKVIIVPQT